MKNKLSDCLLKFRTAIEHYLQCSGLETYSMVQINFRGTKRLTGKAPSSLFEPYCSFPSLLENIIASIKDLV